MNLLQNIVFLKLVIKGLYCKIFAAKYRLLFAALSSICSRLVLLFEKFFCSYVVMFILE
ncbi:MAG: hypothetical protein OFPII_12300 [Osedax symbiont Rs1]|nr:MAG: hypothetical protein OFPII_12300 [Osedax symbiont Rs1]